MDGDAADGASPEVELLVPGAALLMDIESNKVTASLPGREVDPALNTGLI